MKKLLSLLALMLLSACQSSPIKAQELKLLSFNIRYGSANDGLNHWMLRRPLVFDLLKREQADIIGLQEALRFQLDEIAKNVKAYKEIGEGRHGGTKNEYCAILYKPAKFELIDSGTFWLSDTPEKPSKHWGNDHLRICTWGHLQRRTDNKTIFVCNAHLDHRSQNSREKSLKLIATFLAKCPANSEFVLMGDFNAAEDNKAITWLKGKACPVPMRDSLRMLHPHQQIVGTFNGFKGKKNGAKIDYIFVSPEAKVTEASILFDEKNGRTPSDHYPIKAMLNIVPAPR